MSMSSPATFADPFAEGPCRMTALCKSFPTLRRADGVERWHQIKFARWATHCDTRAAQQAAAFVLSVWNGSTPHDGGWWNDGEFSAGRFDVVDAMAYWDAQHKAAFAAWCANPFWP